MKKRLLSLLLTIVMVIGILPAQAFAAEPEYLPLGEIDESLLSDGMFYLGSAGAELPENAGHGYLLKVVRYGSADREAKVRLTMLGQTASYGKDYTVSLYGGGLLEGSVENKDAARSMLDILTENPDAVKEYNYSDAVIDGTTEEQAELSEEERAALERETMELTESLLDAEMEAKAAVAPEGGEMTEAVVAGPEERELSLAEAKELATGLTYDKKPMSGGDAALVAPYLTSQTQALNEALESAYLVLTFKAGESEKYVEITPKDNDRGEGDRTAFLGLTAEENAVVFDGYSAFTLTIIDDEEAEPATVEFSAAEYSPEDGYATVYIRRTGNLTGVLELYVDTEDGSAQKGVNYSEVHTPVQFPFGLTERHVKIPVSSAGLTEPVSFTVRLSAPGGCVLGAQSEAVVTIHPSDRSFRAPDARADGFGELMDGSREYNVNSIVVDESDKGNLLNYIGKMQAASSGPYARMAGDHLELFLGCGAFDDGYLFQSFFAPEKTLNYGYSGVQLDWDRSSTIGVSPINVSYASEGGKEFSTMYKKSVDSLDRQISRFFFCPDTGTGNNGKSLWQVSIGFESRWGMSSDVSMNIYSLRPIYRPFEISLAGAEPVKLINEEGKRVPATQIPEYENSCNVLLEGATHTGTGTLTTHLDEAVTASLKYEGLDSIATIRQLDFYSPDQSTSLSGYSYRAWLTQNCDYTYGKNTAGFVVTNNLLKILSGYWSSIPAVIDYTANGSNGLKGSFIVKPVLANVDTTVTVKKDDRVNITSLDHLTVAKEDASSITYNCHVGDCVRLNVELKPEYQAYYRVYGVLDRNSSVTYRQDDGMVIFKATTKPLSMAPEILDGGDNCIRVAVKTADLSQFDQTRGVFTYPSTVEGDTTYFDVADVEATSGQMQFAPHKYYKLAAYPVNNQYVSLWKITSQTAGFAQNVFPFETQTAISDNMVQLTAAYKDLQNNLVTATIRMEDSGSSDGWYPVEGATVSVDDTIIGVSDANGKATTPAFDVAGLWAPSYVRVTVSFNGAEQYRDYLMDQAGRKSGRYTRDLGTVLFSRKDLSGPFVETVTAQDDKGVYSSRITIDDDPTTLIAYVNYRGENPVRGVPYLDTDGVQRYEKVEKVEFLVVDSMTHEIKYTIEAQPRDGTNGTVWSTIQSFQKGKRIQWKSSDLLYTRVTTNRVIGNGTALEGMFDGNGNLTGYDVIRPEAIQHTTYAPQNSGNWFWEANPADPMTYEIGLNPEGEFSLPVIGSLLMNLNVAGFNLGVESRPGDVLRLSFGKVISEDNRHDGEGNEMLDDSGVFEDSPDAWKDMTNRINFEGEENKIGKMGLGIKAWSFGIILGIYIDFKLAHSTDISDSEHSGTHFYLIGAGVTVGFTGSFRYTYYMIIYGIPVYVGGDVSGTLIEQIGFEASNSDITYDTIKGKSNPLDDLDFDASVLATLTGNVYAGVGICGTLGVRGGFGITLYFAYVPFVTRTYPSFHTTGFKVNGAIKFWADLVLFSAPLSYGGELLNAGYFADLKALENGTLMSANYYESTGEGPTLKPRSGESSFVANAPRLMSTFDPVASRDLVTNNFDAPNPQLASLRYEHLQWNDEKGAESVYTVGDDTYLLVYLDDDTSRASEDRTALMWTVYEDGNWTEPQIVQNDGTADLYPNLCDAGDKVVVTWASRSRTGMTDQADFVSGMEIYTAFFDKRTHTFGEITRLTDDDCYDYAPVAVYDELGREFRELGVLGASGAALDGYTGGDLMIYYMKAQVNKQDAEKVLETTMNPTLNSAEVMYRLYSGATGQWETGRLSDNETMVDGYGGQRFVSSPVSIDIKTSDPEKNAIAQKMVNDPVIIDFDAIMGYNMGFDNEVLLSLVGLRLDDEGNPVSYYKTLAAKTRPIAFYAFTVDADNNMDTDWDRELYIQIYDIAARSTGAPIRITDNDVCDSSPQLVYGYGGDAFLFWLEGGSIVRYTDLTGKLADNNMRAFAASDDSFLTLLTALIKEENPDADLSGMTVDPTPEWSSGIVTVGGDMEANPIYSFTAFADQNNNLFVAYPQIDTDSDGLDIYLTGYIPVEDPAEQLTKAGTWSDPVRMTNGSEINDLPVIAALSGDRLLMVNNRYKMDLTQDEYNTSDTHIVETTYRTVGSLEVVDVQTDSVPAKAGDAFTVTVTLRNTGVKASEGVTYSGRLLLDGTAIDVISEATDGDLLYPTQEFAVTKTFNLPDGVTDLSKLRLEITTREGGAVNSQTETLQLFDGRQSYQISGITVKQTRDGYELTGTVSNTGSAAAKAGDQIELTFNDVYGRGRKGELFAAIPVGELGIGESKEFTASYSVAPELMDVGIINACAEVRNGTEKLSPVEEYMMTLDFPYDVSVNNHAEILTVKEGESLQLTGGYEGGRIYMGGKVLYSVADTAIATVSEDGMLMGVAEGETTMDLSVQPYGGYGTVTVKVTPGDPTPDEPDDPTPYVPSGPGTPTPSTITVEVSGDEGSVSVTASVKDNTATVTAPTEAQLAQITDRAGETGSVTIDLSSLPETVTAVSIPAETVKAVNEAMEAAGEGLTIKLPNSNVTFDAKALAAIAEQTTGTDLKLCVEPTAETKLNEKQRDAIAELDVQAVYDIYLISGGKRINDFSGGTALIEVAYTVKEDQQPGGIVVWYVADTGEKTDVPTTATQKTVKWTVTHFSNYVLAYDKTLPGACPKDDTCPMTAFTDLDKSSWYHDGVHWAIENGVMNGVGNDRFEPSGTTSRGMIVTMLYRMEGEPASDYAMTFRDVEDGKWYAEAVRWAAENGIVNGYSDDAFGPNDPVTREQIVTILLRYARYKGVDTEAGELKPLEGFDDTRDISDWAVKAFRWAVDAGIIQGTGGGKISPKLDASRAQVATMLMRYDAMTQ